MFHIILYQPEIPPNTGNIIRLCANTGAQLHLIEPLGFTLEDKQLKRAGLDYHDLACVTIYPDLATCLKVLKEPIVYALSAKATRLYTSVTFKGGEAFLFGPETRGLPSDILQSLPETQRLRLPQHTTLRSLNLGNTAAVMIYEAWRQVGFVD